MDSGRANCAARSAQTIEVEFYQRPKGPSSWIARDHEPHLLCKNENGARAAGAIELSR